MNRKRHTLSDRDVAPASAAARRLTDYTGNPDQAAICEQMSHMTRQVAGNQKKVEELIEICREMLKAHQAQMQRLDAVLGRIDRAITRGDEGVKIMSDSAETIRLNSDMIVRASLMLAHVMGDEEAVKAAKRKADQEFAEWRKEAATLTLVSGRE